MAFAASAPPPQLRAQQQPTAQMPFAAAVSIDSRGYQSPLREPKAGQMPFAAPISVDSRGISNVRMRPASPARQARAESPARQTSVQTNPQSVSGLSGMPPPPTVARFVSSGHPVGLQANRGELLSNNANVVTDDLLSSQTRRVQSPLRQLQTAEVSHQHTTVHKRIPSDSTLRCQTSPAEEIVPRVEVQSTPQSSAFVSSTRRGTSPVRHISAHVAAIGSRQTVEVSCKPMDENGHVRHVAQTALEDEGHRNVMLYETVDARVSEATSKLKEFVACLMGECKRELTQSLTEWSTLIKEKQERHEHQIVLQVNMQRTLHELCERQRQEMSNNDRQLTELRAEIGTTLEQLGDAHLNTQQSVQELRNTCYSQSAELQSRVGRIEEAVGESASNQSKTKDDSVKAQWEKLHTEHEQQTQALLSGEQQLKDLRAEMSKVLVQFNELEASTKEIHQLRTAYDITQSQLASMQSQLANLQAEHETRGTYHELLQERVQYVEKLIDHSGDTQAMLEAVHSKLNAVQEDQERLQMEQDTLADRMNAAQDGGIPSDALQALTTHVEGMRQYVDSSLPDILTKTLSRMSKIEEAHQSAGIRQERLQTSMNEVERRIDEFVSKLSNQNKVVVNEDVPADAILSRVSYLEGLFGDAVGGHDSLEDRLSAAEDVQAQVQSKLATIDGHVSALQRQLAKARLDSLQKEVEPEPHARSL